MRKLENPVIRGPSLDYRAYLFARVAFGLLCTFAACYWAWMLYRAMLNPYPTLLEHRLPLRILFLLFVLIPLSTFFSRHLGWLLVSPLFLMFTVFWPFREFSVHTFAFLVHSFALLLLALTVVLSAMSSIRTGRRGKQESPGKIADSN